jgi:hypothetical protein
MARWWGPNIKINGEWLRENDDTYTSWLGTNADQWEAEVHNVFRKLHEGSTTGKLLLDEMNKLGETRKCIVKPIRAANFKQTSAKPREWTAAIKKGQQFSCPANDPCSNRPARGGRVAPHADLIQGLGTGGNVYLYYHPASWTAHDQTKAVDVAAGVDSLANLVQPDDVLFHELVHVYRAMMGIFEWVRTGDSWDTTEEFFAVVLTNIYVSETRENATMRGDHSSEFRSQQEVHDSETDEEFLQSSAHRGWVSQMLEENEMRALTSPLSDPVKKIAKWNPLRVKRMQDEAPQRYRSKYQGLPAS